MDFPEAIKAMLAGKNVRRARLVLFDFASGPIGVWQGFGPLQTKDGKLWHGVGELGSISGVAQAINGSSPELRLTLSGVDETFAMKAKAEADEYYNRAVTVFSQYFDEDWQCLDLPFAEIWALMRKLTPAAEMQDDGKVRTITISGETPFATKKRPRFAYLSDRDQQSRHPGDKAAERVQGIDNQLVTFPDF